MSAVLLARQQLKTCLRRFFTDQGYLEVDTPILVHMPGAEIHLEYFASEWTDYTGITHPVFLRSSPEIHMKRLLAAGYPKIFQLAPSFRNHGELSDWHHPEFTMLEWYTADMTLNQLQDQTEQLLQVLVREFACSDRLPPKIPRFTVQQLFKDLAGVDPFAEDFVASCCDRRLVHISDGDDQESVFFKVLLDIVEPALRQYPACFVMEYPASTASLAAIKGGLAQRAELYLDGVEVANGFQELQGEEANQTRLQDIMAARQKLKHTSHPVDTKFIAAMSQLPSSAGNAVGFERLLAWLLGMSDIKALVPFADDVFSSPSSIV